VCAQSKKPAKIVTGVFTCYTIPMQKIATRIFVYSSIVFGIVGILVVLTLPSNAGADVVSNLHILLTKILFATVFFILPSFALSVASKYLID
jgi:hypothetical protein